VKLVSSFYIIYMLQNQLQGTVDDGTGQDRIAVPRYNGSVSEARKSRSLSRLNLSKGSKTATCADSRAEICWGLRAIQAQSKAAVEDHHRARLV
jgi:hypothetical protein